MLRQVALVGPTVETAAVNVVVKSARMDRNVAVAVTVTVAIAVTAVTAIAADKKDLTER